MKIKQLNEKGNWFFSTVLQKSVTWDRARVGTLYFTKSFTDKVIIGLTKER